jgi:DNA-binding protein
MFIISCKENSKEENKTTISSAIENVEEEELTNPLQITKSEKALYKALKKKTPLTNDQLFAVLPKDIHGNKPIGDYALQVSSQLTSGMYKPIGKKGYNFFIQDGVDSSAIIRNFFDSYKIKSQGPPQTEYIYSERAGYKTIAFLQPNIKRNDIRFVYNNRFRITLEGPDSADVLWSYIDFENLKKLDQYN